MAHKFDELEYLHCKHCGSGGTDHLRMFLGVIYCKICWERLGDIAMIKATDKITFIAESHHCDNLEIINGIGTCEGYDDCPYIDSMLNEVYYDCLYGE